MNHHTTSGFWRRYNALPKAIQVTADKNYELLKEDSRHPSLHFKKVGELWSVRIGEHYRALATEEQEGLFWFWIGSHAEYDKVLDNQ